MWRAMGIRPAERWATRIHFFSTAWEPGNPRCCQSLDDCAMIGPSQLGRKPMSLRYAALVTLVLSAGLLAGCLQPVAPAPPPPQPMAAPAPQPAPVPMVRG